MGLIREPLEVDFEVIPSLLTEEEKLKISNYIKAFKAKKNTRLSSQKSDGLKPIKKKAELVAQ
ncbi:MAG: hypothetical protein LH615_01095 [Ferruginibacter sp.]|nr:hypothetical protein [Ferruginibacter sp.]